MDLYDGLAPDSSYTVQVCQTGTSICDQSDSYFKIVSGSSTNSPPRIIGFPAIPTNIQPGQTVNFSWSATDADNDDLSWSVDFGNSGGGSSCSSIRRRGGTGWNYSASHIWNQPGTYRVTATVSDCVGGSDSNSFTVQVGNVTTPSITVLSPNGGESWQVGSAQTIKWRDNGPIVACKIDGSTGVTTCPPPKLYDIKLVPYYPPCTIGFPCASAPYPYIASYTIAKGVSGQSYQWSVGQVIPTETTPQSSINNIAPDGSYTVYICQTGTSTCDSSDSYFTIAAAQTIPIKSISIDASNNVYFSLSQQASACLQLKDSQGNYFALNSSQFSYSCANTTLFTGYQTELVIPQSSFTKTIIAGQYYQVCNADTRGNIYAVCSNPILVTTSTQPSITVLSPNGGESWQSGTTQTIRWSGSVAGSVNISLTSYFSCWNEEPACNAPTVLYPIASNVSGSSYNWTLGSNIPDGQYKVNISSVVSPGVTDQSDSPFTIVAGTTTTSSVQSASLSETASALDSIQAIINQIKAILGTQ